MAQQVARAPSRASLSTRSGVCPYKLHASINTYEINSARELEKLWSVLLRLHLVYLHATRHLGCDGATRAHHRLPRPLAEGGADALAARGARSRIVLVVDLVRAAVL